MAFFGVTRHGTYNHLLEKQPAYNPTPFAAIADVVFDRAFDAHRLGADSPNARALQVLSPHIRVTESLDRGFGCHGAPRVLMNAG